MSSVLLALALGALIGGVLGGLGGGGAVLTVPALVYLLHQPVAEATAGSLVVVGASALAGLATYARSRLVEWRVGALLVVVGLPATSVGTLLSHRVDPDVLLLGFAGVMLLAAVPLFRDGPGADPAEPPGPTAAAARRTPWVPTVLAATVVGALTGYFGVGGGFVVVPALVLGLRLPVQRAVGTSLLVVAANAALALGGRVAGADLDPEVLVPFAAAAVGTSVVAARWAPRLPARPLRRGFAALLVVVAVDTALAAAGVPPSGSS